MWFDPGLAGLFITSTLLHLGEDINSLIVSFKIIDFHQFDLSPILYHQSLANSPNCSYYDLHITFFPEEKRKDLALERKFQLHEK